MHPSERALASGERSAEAAELLTAFAERTGVTGSRSPRRYLWTDAFAVCTFLGLWRETSEGRFRQLALALVDGVHHVLGRFREDDVRTGWISGLDEAAGEAHPTLGGLRIGKPLPERGPREPFDAEREWDRDGQYFHYLTKWMHALDQTARATGELQYGLWARELAASAHRAFTQLPGGRRGKGMAWKMSTDLSRAQVPSKGQHDPLDGYVTCAQLLRSPSAGPDLAPAMRDFAALIEVEELASADPLGLGGLLVDAYRLAQLGRDRELVAALLAASEAGLAAFLTRFDPAGHAGQRLAFRELGLALGLAAASALAASEGLDPAARRCAQRIARLAPLREEIESFWSIPAHRRTDLWLEHADIDDVMLAASLAPDGFLVLRTSPAGS